MTSLPCLSILQPYAWLIVNGHKDVENRSWSSGFRGRLLIHAGKRYGPRIHAGYAEEILEDFGITLPPFESMQVGGIVGSATMVDCVQEHPSRWKTLGSWAFVLSQPRVRPFVPYRGQLGFFNCPAGAISPAVG